MKIAIIGNCQAGELVRVLAKIPRDRLELDCRYVVSYQDPAAGDKEFVASADRILFQLADFDQKNDPLKELNAFKGRKIAFPLLAANFLYPFAMKAHPRNAESRSTYYPAGHYEVQVSDAHLVKLMEAHPQYDTRRLVDKFLSEDYSTLIDLDRLFEINKHKMERIGNDAGLNLWPVIERTFRDQPLFWTFGHPAAFLLERLSRFALESLDIGLSALEIDAAIAAAAADVNESLGIVHMPIHPSVSEHFGLTWVRPTSRYRYFMEGSFDIREFFSRYVEFTYDVDLYQSIQTLHEGGDLDEGILALTAARDRLPYSPDIHDVLAAAYARKGLVRDTLGASLNAVSLAPHRSEIVSHLAHWTHWANAQMTAPTTPVFQVGPSYQFAVGNKETQAALVSGWSPPEHWGVWSNGRAANLRFEAQCIGGKNIDLDFGIVPFVPLKDGNLVVDVLVNGRPFATWRFDNSDYLKVVVNRSLIGVLMATDMEAHHMDIVFRIKNPTSPAQAGMNKDIREIGLGLHTLAINARLSSTETMGAQLPARAPNKCAGMSTSAR